MTKDVVSVLVRSSVHDVAIQLLDVLPMPQHSGSLRQRPSRRHWRARGQSDGFQRLDRSLGPGSEKSSWPTRGIWIRRAMLKAMAIGYARKRQMYKRNAVQLRLAFSAAAVGAVLAAATFSGAHRAGSLVRQTVRETEPILVGSISTIKNPGGEKAGTRR
jgi:hypothetical protein